MEREKSPEQLREERVANQASVLLKYLLLSLDLDTIHEAVRGRKSEGTKSQLKHYLEEMEALETRRKHAFELPPWLRRLDRGISLDENSQGMREKILAVFRTKPLAEAEYERLEVLKKVLDLFDF